MLVQRVFDVVESVKSTSYSPRQVSLIREALRRNFERNSQDNGYFLNLISRRYEDGDTADLSAAVNVPARIETLSGEAIQQAAQTYLNSSNYVKVILMPEGRARGVEPQPAR